MKQVKPVRDWPLIAEKTAVLVVDVQKSETQAAVLEQYPEYADALNNRMLPNLAQLVRNTRAAGCEIIYTVIESLTDDGRDVGLDHKLSGIFIAKGSELATILPQAGYHADDIVLPKTSCGVFNATILGYLLRNMGKTNVIVAGLLTDQCVDMAVRDGADLGFYMVCAHDACATRTNARHEQSLRAFGGYCRLQRVSEILTDLEKVGRQK